MHDAYGPESIITKTIFREEQNMRLKGKTAVVTGGSSGLGEGICHCLVREGANILIGDIQEDLAKTVSQNISKNRLKMSFD